MGVNPVVLEIMRGSLRSTIQEMELRMECCAMSLFKEFIGSGDGANG